MGESGRLRNSYGLTGGDDTRRHYDEWAETYDTELADGGYAQPRRAAEALTRLLPDRAAVVLDAGCGTGLSGIALDQVGFGTIDGCDYSTGMLARAERTGAYRTLREVDLNQPLPFAAGTYDAVTAVGVLSFGHVAVDALDELLRVVRPGGALVVATNNAFYEEGQLVAKIDELVAAGFDVIIRERGDHIPGIGMEGWVIGGLKTGHRAGPDSG